MRPSQSTFLDLRGLRYHCRTWGEPSAPRMVVLHGWMDVGASFQFFVDALAHDWYVIAPDWRGYGETSWTSADSYWFADYLADLELVLAHYSPDAPVNLVGHSMGGNVASLYAGVRPARIARFANLEGFGMRGTVPQDAPARYARWIDELAAGARFKPYADFDALAVRLREQNPRLTPERAAFLARHWGRESPDGQVVLRGDPRHKIVNPVQYQVEEAKACWRAITAPVLWVEGGETRARGQMWISEAEAAERRACYANLTQVTIPEAGHMMHLDQPERLARVVEAFLRA